MGFLLLDLSFYVYVLQIVVCPFSFGHCVACFSSIYGFRLSFWYLQALLVLWRHLLSWMAHLVASLVIYDKLILWSLLLSMTAHLVVSLVMYDISSCGLSCYLG